jgi:cytochrome c2
MKWSHLGAAALMAIMMQAQPARAQDAEHGEKVFRKCTACHKLGDDAKNTVGPVLNGVIGRTAGTYDDYKYGKSLVAAGEAGLVWNEELIAQYIANPKEFLKTYLGEDKIQAKMTFKLGNEQDRLDVVAYLKTFSPDAPE